MLWEWQKEERGGVYQEVRRRREEQWVGPSSRASREAAASNCPSVNSHPPFGTVIHYGGRKEGTMRTRLEIVS